MTETFVSVLRPTLEVAPAIAGPMGVSADIKRARELFNQGMSLYSEKKDQEAKKAFTAAAELFENDDTPGVTSLLEKAAYAARSNVATIDSLR